VVNNTIKLYVWGPENTSTTEDNSLSFAGII
jgi:hypothetical protein